MAIIREDAGFVSSDGSTRVYGTWWLPEGEPKAIFQCAHGMAEYIDRYDPFCSYLAGKGYAVCGIDYLGHGKTSSPENYGYMAKKDGWKLITRDVHTMTGIAKKKFPGKKTILLGHSMGSFVVRYYAEQWSQDIDGLIICGTGGTNPAVGAGIAVLSVLRFFEGGRAKSKFAKNLAFGKYQDRIKNPKTEYDWLSVDEKNVEDYVADPMCGFDFTLSGYQDLLRILKRVSDRDSWTKIRKDLPVFVIAGAEDPVGNYGEGPKEVADNLRTVLSDVELKIYDGMRHEILRETEKEKVWGDVTDWCSARGM
ncbi:MAG: alpha/beta fold hydrolase [Oscillospiraceae bacterium]|jgi:alpha-beta hydrolase superfamily lysophospholipase